MHVNSVHSSRTSIFPGAWLGKTSSMRSAFARVPRTVSSFRSSFLVGIASDGLEAKGIEITSGVVGVQLLLLFENGHSCVRERCDQHFDRDFEEPLSKDQ